MANNIKNKHIADFTSLEIYKRDYLYFLGNVYPIKVHIKNIQWFNFFHKLNEEDQYNVNIAQWVQEKNIEELLDTIFESIEWDLTDIVEEDSEYKIAFLVETQKVKDWVNYKALEDKKIEALSRITHSLKHTLILKSLQEKDIKNEIEQAYMQIYSIQSEIIEEFSDTCYKSMRMDEKEDKVFVNQFQMYMKTAILRNIIPIFPENIGKSYMDYSFREVKIRTLFEQKEYQINLALLAQFGSAGIQV